jgi:glutathione S-transferase
MLFMSSVLYPALLRSYYAERYTASPAGVAEVKQFALAESDRAFAILDAALAGRDWLVGDRCSIADIYLLMLGCWHPVDDRPRDEWTNLVRHAAALKQLPEMTALNAAHRMW